MSQNILYGERLDAKTAEAALSAPRDIKQATQWRRDKNLQVIAETLEARRAAGMLRMDSSQIRTQAFHFARELEHVYQGILREEYAPNNALSLFAQDTSVPPGAKTHTVRRILHEADVRYYDGNASNRGSTGASKVEKEFPVHPIVTTIKWDYFEQLTAGFANSGLRTELEFAAKQGIEDFLNDKTWEGDADRGVRGVLNYDWLPKSVSGVVFDDTTSADAILAELHRLARFSYVHSKQKFRPNRMILGTRLMDYLGSRKRSPTTDQTILEAFLQDRRRIQPMEVVEAQELDGVGPNGEDAILFDRANDRMAIANVIPQGFSMLPVQRTGFELEIPCYMIHGGVIMRFPLNNHLAYIQGPPT